MFESDAETVSMMDELSRGDAKQPSGYDTVHVRPEHLILLRHGNVSSSSREGSPGLDSKRPFGNSDVYADMLLLLLPGDHARYREALDAGDDGAADAILDGTLRGDFRRLLTELTGVMSVGLGTLHFKEGIYRRPRYGRGEWKRVG